MEEKSEFLLHFVKFQNLAAKQNLDRNRRCNRPASIVGHRRGCDGARGRNLSHWCNKYCNHNYKQPSHFLEVHVFLLGSYLGLGPSEKVDTSDGGALSHLTLLTIRSKGEFGSLYRKQRAEKLLARGAEPLLLDWKFRRLGHPRLHHIFVLAACRGVMKLEPLRKLRMEFRASAGIQ